MDWGFSYDPTYIMDRKYPPKAASQWILKYNPSLEKTFLSLRISHTSSTELNYVLPTTAIMARTGIYFIRHSSRVVFKEVMLML